MKYSLIEIKNNLQGNNIRVNKAENQSNDLEHKEAKKERKKTIRTTRRKKNPKKTEDSESSLWDYFRHSNIYIIEVPDWEEKEQETGNLFEKIVKEKFPNLVKEIDMQVQ